MRIGFDIDGVLANFALTFSWRLIRAYGNRFPVGMDLSNPPKWDWFYPYYTKEEVKTVFNFAHTDPFWYQLDPFVDNVSSLALVLKDLEHKHDVYFITNRGGSRAKRNTEAWLSEHLPFDEDVTPTVLLCGDKGAAAKALQLDVYIDDNLDNIKNVLRESPKTRAYLLDRAYNQGDVSVKVLRPTSDATPDFETRAGIRVYSLAQMLDIELRNL